MRISYTTCDGVTKVEEEIIGVKFYQSLLPPHEVFIRCIRPDGDFFEIYNLESVDFIQA